MIRVYIPHFKDFFEFSTRQALAHDLLKTHEVFTESLEGYQKRQTPPKPLIQKREKDVKGIEELINQHFGSIEKAREIAAH